MKKSTISKNKSIRASSNYKKILTISLIVIASLVTGLYVLGSAAQKGTINLVGAGSKGSNTLSSKVSSDKLTTTRTTSGNATANQNTGTNAFAGSNLGGKAVKKEEEDDNDSNIVKTVITGAQVVQTLVGLTNGVNNPLEAYNLAVNVNNVAREITNKDDGGGEASDLEKTKALTAKQTAGETAEQKELRAKLTSGGMGAGISGTNGDGDQYKKEVFEKPNELGGTTTTTREIKVDKQSGNSEGSVSIIKKDEKDKTISEVNLTASTTVKDGKNVTIVKNEDTNKVVFTGVTSGSAADIIAPKKNNSGPTAPNAPSKTNSANGTNPDKLCKAGNITVAAGTWVSTGATMGEGKETQRQCVQIDENCDHKGSRACSEVYSADPTSVVLPVSAGVEYTQGLASNDPKAEKDQKVKANCYNGAEVVPSGNSREDKGVCEDGGWMTQAAYNAMLLKQFKESNKLKPCTEGKQSINGVEVWITCNGNSVANSITCNEGKFDDNGKCVPSNSIVETAINVAINTGLGAAAQNPELVVSALSGAAGAPATIGTFVGAGVPFVANVISSAAEAPDAGYIDNIVGFGSGMSAAGAMLPVCISSTLLNPILFPLCEAASFTGGALIGSKATDVIVHVLDN